VKRRNGGILLFVALILGATSARAEPPSCGPAPWRPPRLCDLRHWLKGWCPDDYRPKGLPHVPCVPPGCVDDYCPKGLPRVPWCLTGCVDDYCPKCCPVCPGKPFEPWYTCGPAGSCGCPK
jgi:hypothetical protein